MGHSFSPGLFLADGKAKKTKKSHTLSIFSQSQLWPLCSGSRVVSSLLFHNQNLLQFSHFFLQGLSSDLITFSGHSLISESFLPRTPVRPCLPHIFSFSLQNTEHDIPRCAHASPVCSVLFQEGLGCSCTFSTLESTHRGLAVFVPWVGSCPHSCELQQQTLSLSFNYGFLPPPLSPERSMSCPQV